MHDVHGISGLSLETGGAAATEPLAAPRRGPDRAFQRLPLLAINGTNTGEHGGMDPCRLNHGTTIRLSDGKTLTSLYR